MWSALFEVLKTGDRIVPYLAETAIFSQWFHTGSSMYYARWDGGEVDIVSLNSQQKPVWALEVKWSDRYVTNPSELKSLLSFCNANSLTEAAVTTLTQRCSVNYKGIELKFVPSSVYCWTVGHNIVKRQARRLLADSTSASTVP
jgi:hypothetical protein